MYFAQLSSSAGGSIHCERLPSCSADVCRSRIMRGRDAGESGTPIVVDVVAGRRLVMVGVDMDRISSVRRVHLPAIAIESTLSTNSCDCSTSRVRYPPTSLFYSMVNTKKRMSHRRRSHLVQLVHKLRQSPRNDVQRVSRDLHERLDALLDRIVVLQIRECDARVAGQLIQTRVHMSRVPRAQTKPPAQPATATHLVLQTIDEHVHDFLLWCRSRPCGAACVRRAVGGRGRGGRCCDAMARAVAPVHAS